MYRHSFEMLFYLVFQFCILRENQIEELRTRRNLREVRNCFLKPMFLHVVLHLDRLGIVGVVEAEGSSNDRCQRLGLFAALDELRCRRDEAILCAELALRPACDARHGIGEVLILEPLLRRVDVCRVLFAVKAVLRLSFIVLSILVHSMSSSTAPLSTTMLTA